MPDPAVIPSAALPFHLSMPLAFDYDSSGKVFTMRPLTWITSTFTVSGIGFRTLGIESK